MSARGMLAAINSARQKAWPASPTSQGAVEWQLREAATPLAVTAVRAAAQTGDREAVVAALHQQLPSLQPTPLHVTQHSSYWSQGRVMFWSGLLLCSFLLLVWDLKLADAWEDWCLSRRQAARARGKKFTVQENLDDMVTLLMKGVQSKVAGAQLVPVAAKVDGQQQPQQVEPLLQQQPQQQQNRVAGAFARRQQQQQQQQSKGTEAEQAVQQLQVQTQEEQQQDLTMKQQQSGSWVLDQQV